MGITLTGPYETEQGVVLENAYVSFALNTFSIQPYVEDSVKKYKLQCSYELYANAAARENGSKRLEKGDVSAFTTNVENVYAPLYEQLKIVFPDSVDDASVGYHPAELIP